jgi:hypothetical protein
MQSKGQLGAPEPFGPALNPDRPRRLSGPAGPVCQTQDAAMMFNGNKTLGRAQSFSTRFVPDPRVGDAAMD